MSNSLIFKILIKFYILVLLSSCGDNGSNCPGDMKLPIEIIPYKLFFNIGDTITLSSKFHKLIYDQKTDKYYDATNYKFSPFIQLFTLDSSAEYNSYSRINELAVYNSNFGCGAFKESLGELVGEYQLIGDTFNLNINLVCIKNGNRMLRFGSLSSGDGHLQNNYKFNCRGRKINFYLAFPKVNNIQLLQQFRSNERNDWILSDPINRFINYAGYCFEVR